MGDAEDEDEEPEVRRVIKRRLKRKPSRLHSSKGTPHRSATVSRAITPPPPPPKEPSKKSEKEKEALAEAEVTDNTDAADVKRAVG